MVVTRRQSASPIPPVASRTTSSSGSSRSSKGKGTERSSPLKDSSPGPSHVAPNGTPSKPPPVGPHHLEEITFDDDAPPAPPPKSSPTKPPVKSRSKPKAKKSSKSKKRHVNKGISGFDIIARLFLLWLTIYTLSVCPEDTQLRSPVCRALTEYRRVVLEPYIYPPIRAMLDHPAVAPYVQRVEPHYNRVVQLSTPLVHRVRHHWRSRLTPLLHRLQLRTRPYVLIVQRQYDATLGPYVRQVSNTALRYRLKAEPYILAAAIRSHRSWEAMQPYLTPAWLATKQVPGIVAEYVGGPLGRARRRWVDPQVIKIWDAVNEQGKANTSVGESTNTSSASSASTSSIAASTSTTPIGDVSKTSSISTSSIPKSTNQAGASASSIKSASASKASPEPDSMSSPPVVPPHSAQTDEVTESTSSKNSYFHGEKQIPSDGHRMPPSEEDDEEEDAEELESFLSELEVDSTNKVEESPPPPQEQEESEEEREERIRLAAIETAQKRAEIEARHTQWEKDLEDLGNAQSKVVRTTLKNLRKVASDEARAPNGPVREQVEGLVQDAEKSLKSLKAYARKLGAEDKPKNEKIKQWEKVVEKVDKKFGERVDSTATAVRAWLDAKIEQENQEIAFISREVTNLAYKAQENLGMDYAWLADGSYYDWQRFHKLVDTGQSFADLYAGIQNGSVPNSPANPVSDIMEALQEEVDDVILGFDTNLGRVRNEGIDSFEAKMGGAPSAPSDEGSPPVATSDSGPVPNVSILPINPDEAKGKVEVPPVILSRGREEVQSALSKAEEAKTKAAHTEL